MIVTDEKRKKYNMSLKTPLQIDDILSDAIDIPSRKSAPIIRIMLVPAILILIIGMILDYHNMQEKGLFFWVMAIMQGLFFTIFAVSCHRIVLNPPENIASLKPIYWGFAETKFLFYSTGLGLVSCVAIIAATITIISINFAVDFRISKDWGILMGALFLIPTGYLVARLSLVLPAVAINKKLSFAESWKKSIGNGWRLFILLTAFPCMTSLVISQLPSGTKSVFISFISWSISIFVVIVEISLLSLAYFQLIKQPETRT